MNPIRKPHYLRPNAKSETPSRLIALDVETYQDRVDDTTVSHRLRLGWMAYFNRTRTGRWTDPVWHYVDDSRKAIDVILSYARDRSPLWVVAHNADFDWGVLRGYTELPKRGFQLTRSWDSHGHIYRKYRNCNKTVVIHDSMLLWPFALSVLGKSLGVEKLDPAWSSDNDDEVSQYCHRDVEILVKAYQWWLDWIKDEDLGNFSPTIASQSFHAFRHKFMSHRILIHCNDRVTELERDSYHGGRTECRYIGRRDSSIYVLDVNSMYPYVMRNNDYPVKLLGLFKNIPVKSLSNAVKKYCTIARVQLDTNEDAYPYKHNNKLVFPVGRFETCLTTPEIAYAIDHNHIQRVIEVAVYEREPIFTSYVDYMYEKREEAKRAGDKARTLAYKLLMNSLYGKFGQRTVSWETIGKADIDECYTMTAINPVTHERETYRIHEGVIEKCVGSKEAYDAFPAISAHVTAYARMYLYSLIRMAGDKHVYYADTDSLFVDEEGLNNLAEYINEYTLGKLKVESVSDYIDIRAPKDYSLSNKEKVKGVRNNAECVALNTYTHEMWPRIASRIRDGILTTPVIKRGVKILKRDYTARQISDDGFTYPVVLP